MFRFGTCAKQVPFLFVKNARQFKTRHELIVLVFSLSACGGRTEKWAYSHDPLEEVISLSDNGWSYQFTENGEFSEENIFHGHYLLDEKNSCIKLMYDDPDNSSGLSFFIKYKHFL